MYLTVFICQSVVAHRQPHTFLPLDSILSLLWATACHNCVYLISDLLRELVGVKVVLWLAPLPHTLLLLYGGFLQERSGGVVVSVANSVQEGGGFDYRLCYV